MQWKKLWLVQAALYRLAELALKNKYKTVKKEREAKKKEEKRAVQFAYCIRLPWKISEICTVFFCRLATFGRFVQFVFVLFSFSGPSLSLYLSLSPFLRSASSFVCARLSSLINSISSAQSLIKINYNNRRKTRKIAFRRLLKRVFAAADRGSSGRGQAKCQLIIFQPQLRTPRRRRRTSR